MAATNMVTLMVALLLVVSMTLASAQEASAPTPSAQTGGAAAAAISLPVFGSFAAASLLFYIFNL